MKTVTADTLAAALVLGLAGKADLTAHLSPEELAAAILDALPPDPRLDALLAEHRAAERYCLVHLLSDDHEHPDGDGCYVALDEAVEAALDALAAFEQQP